MGAALAAIADDDDFLALDEVEIGIPVIIDAHVKGPFLNNSAGISGPAGLRQASISMGPMRPQASPITSRNRRTVSAMPKVSTSAVMA